MLSDINSVEAINFPISELEQLERNGYLYQEAQDVFRDGLINFQSYLRFTSLWNLLDSKSLNQRESGSFKYDPSSITPLEYINQDLNDEFASSSFLRKLISYDLSKLPKKYLMNCLKINIHLVRTSFTGNTLVDPGPEEDHQSECDYVVQHLIAKYNLKGGESTIYDLKKQPLFSRNLSLPLQTIFFKVPKVSHQVSSVTPEKAGGYRDMLIIDFKII